MSSSAIDAINRVLAEADDADEALRAVVTTLAGQSGIVWAGIAFVERGALTLGPAAGEPDERRRHRAPVAFQGALVGELWADGDPDRSLLEQVAARLAPHVLIGWDTGGEDWEP